MPRKGRMFAGCTVALVTPFKDGAVDEPALRRLVDWQIAQGTPILSPVGTTGEAPTLTHDEHERVIAVVVEAAAGRAKVMAGTGSNSTAEAIRLTRFAARTGADGALWSLPITTGRTRKGSTAISRRSPRASTSRWFFTTSRPGPVEMSSPRRSNVWPALGPIVAVKEAAGSLDQVSELVVRTDLTILSGDDSLTLPMLAVGAEGVVSVIANLVPRDVMALLEAFRKHRVEQARDLSRPPVSTLPRLAGPRAQSDPGQDGPRPPGPGQR